MEAANWPKTIANSGILHLFHCCRKEFILVDCSSHIGFEVENVAEIMSLHISEGIMIVHDWAIVIRKCARNWVMFGCFCAGNNQTCHKTERIKKNDCPA